MKGSLSLITTLLILFFAVSVDAQVKSVKKETKRQGTWRINRKIDQGVDKGLDKIEDGIGSIFGKKKKKKGNSSEENTTVSNTTHSSSGGSMSVAGKDPEELFREHGMYPPDGATDVPVPLTLKWTPMNSSDFKASSYELYLEEGETNPMKMLGSSRSTKKECKNLKPNTTYSWSYKGQASNGQYMPGGGGTFTTGEAGPMKMDVQWAKFDFIPGDQVIFEDGPDIMEENGEFPSRWDLHEGNIEIASANGETVIMFLASGGIVPYMKNSKEDYLPEVFTLECDMYFTPGESGRYWIYLNDKKNQRHIGDNIEVFVNGIECGDSEMRYPGTENLGWYQNKKGGWKHISVAFTKGKLKAYMDDTRLINIPHYEGNPTGITISAEKYDYQPFIKNIRIAKGGVKYYDRILNDGKIICNGIRFDVNKATLKPESMGPINKIYELMSKKPELKFSVEGHTDADGDDTRNQTLSEQRAKAVMERLIAMGIAADRLTSKGFGESKPIDNNSTPEGKANNRRVEFVTFTGSASSSIAKPASNGGNSVYDKINAGNIDKEFDKLTDEFYTPISGPNGIINGKGTIFLFFTSDRNLGKMEILDVDKNDNYKTTIKYATYNQAGETVSESNSFEIEGTFAFDLDNGNSIDPERADWDFVLKRSNETSTSFAMGGEKIALRKYQ